jgi:hypothetical protein
MNSQTHRSFLAINWVIVNQTFHCYMKNKNDDCTVQSDPGQQLAREWLNRNRASSPEEILSRAIIANTGQPLECYMVPFTFHYGKMYLANRSWLVPLRSALTLLSTQLIMPYSSVRRFQSSHLCLSSLSQHIRFNDLHRVFLISHRSLIDQCSQRHFGVLAK